jgi:Flp pilus assembly protein TadG
MTHTNNRKSRGQSLVEVALVLPILVMLLLGLLDFGRAYYTIVALRDAADEGAAFGATNPSNVAGIRRRAAEASRALVNIQESEVSVSAPVLATGKPITVTVTTTLVLYTPFANTLVSDSTLTLRGHSVRSIINP